MPSETAGSSRGLANIDPMLYELRQRGAARDRTCEYQRCANEAGGVEEGVKA